jgi:hypothetical protein
MQKIFALQGLIKFPGQWRHPNHQYLHDWGSKILSSLPNRNEALMRHFEGIYSVPLLGWIKSNRV